MSDGVKKAVLILGFVCAAASWIFEKLNWHTADVLMLIAYTCVAFSLAF